MTDPLERLQHHRPLILTAEVAALLHLIGKLDSRFIEHESQEGGPSKYHYKTFYEGTDLKDIILDHRWKNLLRSTYSSPKVKVEKLSGGPDNLTPFFKKHDDKGHGEPQINFLQQAHGIVSGLEKNLYPPSTTKYLKQPRAQTFRATAFGWEETNLSEMDFATIQNDLFPCLHAVLKRILDDHAGMNVEQWGKLLSEIKGKLRTALDQGVGDTRRPVNEVTLWDQSYMTACLYKSALARLIINPETFDPGEKVSWRVLTVGIDMLGLLSRSIKIGDAKGLWNTATNALDAVQRFIEIKLCMGNEIFRDTSGVYFSFPGIEDQAVNQAFKEWIREEVHRIFAGHDLEVSPAVCISEKASRSFLRLVESRQEACKELVYPIRGDVEIKDSQPSGNICPVCQLRLNGDPTSREKVCPICRERRRGRLASWRNARARGDTIWLEEVADRHDRVALLVAQFGLTPWLTGECAETLRAQSIPEWMKHNSQDSDISALGDQPDALLRRLEENWNTQEPLLKKLAHYQNEAVPTFYETIVEERDVLGLAGSASSTSEQARLLLHNLFKKYPSPARIRRFWETTSVFLHNGTQELRSRYLPGQLRTRRLWIIPENPSVFTDETLYDGRVNGQPISLFWNAQEGRFVTASNLEWLAMEGETIDALSDRLTATQSLLSLKAEHEAEWRSTRLRRAEPVQDQEPLASYWPVVPLVESPDLYMVLLPTAEALEAVQSLRKKYQREMSKVRERLPFHLGLVYFPKKMPLFTVVEAGRRMAERFTNQQAESWQVRNCQDDSSGKTCTIDLARNDGTGVRWDVSYGFPDPEPEDWFTPYFAAEGPEVSTRRHTFTVPGGPGQTRVHVKELKNGDRLQIHPSRFSFLFMDTTTRRFEAASKPRYLEDVDTMVFLWETLKKQGLTQTQLHTGWAELERARNELGEGIFLETFVESVLINEWGLKGEELEQIKRGVQTRLLDESLELFVRIMKMPLRKECDNGRIG